MKIELILQDDSMPRTLFWDTILGAISKLESTSTFPSSNFGALHICHEDTAMELNWPRYDIGKSAYVRGDSQDRNNSKRVISYIKRAINWAANNPRKNLLLFNNHPFFRICTELSVFSNIYVADVSLSQLENSINPNTISAPAFPIQTCPFPLGEDRSILACFQGVASHPVRNTLAKYNNGKDIIVNLIGKDKHPSIHFGSDKTPKDTNYQSLFLDSFFAFIPRGDALFSYRLLEAMSFGCIPIIVSDGWVLPYSRTVDWNTIALRPSHDEIPACLQFIRKAPRAYILEKQRRSITAYNDYFRDTSTMLRSCLRELLTLLRDKDT
jgi:hypothetical protein